MEFYTRHSYATDSAPPPASAVDRTRVGFFAILKSEEKSEPGHRVLGILIKERIPSRLSVLVHTPPSGQYPANTHGLETY